MLGSRMLALVALLCFAHAAIAAKEPPVPQAIGDVPYYFDHTPYVHPRIVEDLNTWLSDGGDQVVAINLTDSQDSNRYFGDVTLVETEGEKPLVMFKKSEGYFGYRYIGSTHSGVHILQTTESGGGTGIFENLMLVVLQNGKGLFVHEDTHVIDLGTPRVLIRKLGEIPLGDRYEGTVELKGSQLRIGADTGRIGRVRKLPGEEPEPDRVFNLDFANP
jgi:hypothetical protein